MVAIALVFFVVGFIGGVMLGYMASPPLPSANRLMEAHERGYQQGYEEGYHHAVREGNKVIEYVRTRVLED